MSFSNHTGIIIAAIGILIFIIFIANENMGMVEKIPLAALSIFLIVIGLVIETPLFKRWTERNNQIYG